MSIDISMLLSTILFDVFVVVAENIHEVNRKNAAELTVLDQIKIRVHSDYEDPTAIGTDHSDWNNDIISKHSGLFLLSIFSIFFSRRPA